MAITISAFTGSETVGTTEHSLTDDAAGPGDDTTVGVFQAFLDLSAVAAGDVFEFAIYEKVGATQRALMKATFADVQATPHWVSPPIMLGVGWDMTLVKISGTDRAIEWRIGQSA